MTRREFRFFNREKNIKISKKAIRELDQQIRESFLMYGCAGTWVGMEDGEVKIKVLSFDELKGLDTNNLPSEVTFSIKLKQGAV